MAEALAATAAFNELIDTLAAIRDEYVLSDERLRDDLERVEGYRYVTAVAVRGVRALGRGRPRTPPLLVDRVAGAQVPRRQSRRALPAGGHPRRSFVPRHRSARRPGLHLVHRALPPIRPAGSTARCSPTSTTTISTIDGDGSFELILSPDEQPGNWVRLDPRARFVFVRNYYLNELSAQNDPDVHVRLHIEPLDDPGPAAAAVRRHLRVRLRDATAFLHAGNAGPAAVRADPPCRSARTSPTPSARRGASATPNIDAAGAVDIFYSSGRFDLAPGKALVMEGTMPECRVRQRHVVERAHADARVPLPADAR